MVKINESLQVFLILLRARDRPEFLNKLVEQFLQKTSAVDGLEASN